MQSPLNPYEPSATHEASADGSSGRTKAEPIPFAGALSVSEVYEASRLAEWAVKRITRWIAWCVAGLTASYLAWFSMQAYLRGDRLISIPLQVVVLLPALVTGFAIHVARVVSLRRQANRLRSERKGPYVHTMGHVSRAHIESKTESAETTLQWSGFCGYRKTNRVVVLYQSFPGLGFAFSRSKFRTDEDWHAFLRIVEEKLPYC